MQEEGKDQEIWSLSPTETLFEHEKTVIEGKLRNTGGDFDAKRASNSPIGP